MSQGKKSNWLKGGLIGGGAGLVGGLVLGLIYEDQVCEGSFDVSAGAIAAMGLAGGFGIGAGIGSASKSERWKKAELQVPPPVAVNVGKDGSVRLAVSLRL